MSHEIPQTTATYGRQKPRNINDLISTIENTDRELRATFSSNHPQPAPRVTSSPTNKLRRKNHRQRSTGNYRAPNGALRRDLLDRAALPAGRQKAPSAIRCIKTLQQGSFFFFPVGACQKAPSAKRYMKTHRRA